MRNHLKLVVLGGVLQPQSYELTHPQADPALVAQLTSAGVEVIQAG